MPLNPLTKKKLNRFRSIKRSYYSFVLLTTLVLLSCIAELLVNSRALVVSYQGELHFPTYSEVKTGEMFGLNYGYEVNYRELKQYFIEDSRFELKGVIIGGPGQIKDQVVEHFDNRLKEKIVGIRTLIFNLKL